ncbi:hypothetical protein RHOSPDRAFT_32001 [Rhodotorula sp. JG-1b]|nr:hypothetical protein RHOSPDRAFT_32001 [Rhodotorula sp. JG-1b]
MNSGPNSAPSQPIASTSQSKASPAPSRAQPPLADRIDGVANTASTPDKKSDAPSGQASKGDSRWSAEGWQTATPVGGKPGSSKQAPANGSAAPANESSRKAQAQARRSPASTSCRPAPRLTDRIGSPAVRPSSPAAMPPSRSRSSTPARQSSSSARTSTSARASPATGAQPSLLSRLGHQANSPRPGPHVDRSRRSSMSSDMSLSSSDRIAASSPPVPLMARLQSGVSVNGHGDDSRGPPTLSTTAAVPRAQNGPSSFSMSVLGSAPRGSNNSSQASRPAYMEKPAFDPSNRPGPQSIRGTGSAQADRVAPSSSQAPHPSSASAIFAQADPATRFAPTGVCERLHFQLPRERCSRTPQRLGEATTRPQLFRRARRTVMLRRQRRPPPPRPMLQVQQELPTPPPPINDRNPLRADRQALPNQNQRPVLLRSTILPPQLQSQHRSNHELNRLANEANADSSQASSSTQRIKREAKTPELDGARANGAGHPPAARSAAAQDADDAATWAETAARYEAAVREIALLRRQEAALEALRRERAASAKAREEAPPGDQVEQQARRAALLRDKMEREKAERQAAERARKAQGNEDGHRTVNAANAELASRGSRGPVVTSSARSEEQQTESATNGAAQPEAVSSGVGTTSRIVTANQSDATATVDASPHTTGESAATLNKDTRRKRTASPRAAAPSAKHARMEALGIGFAGDDSESEGTSGPPQLLLHPSHAEVKILLPNDDARLATGPARSLAGGRTGRFARRTPSGSPFSTRDAAAAFEPSLSAFLASFDVSLVSLAGPLIAAGFASVVDLARFASFEPDTRLAVLDALRTSNGDRVMLDLDAVDALEDACAAAKAAKWLNCS